MNEEIKWNATVNWRNASSSSSIHDGWFVVFEMGKLKATHTNQVGVVAI
jgi:hypothetical protein